MFSGRMRIIDYAMIKLDLSINSAMLKEHEIVVVSFGVQCIWGGGGGGLRKRGPCQRQFLLHQKEIHFKHQR